MPVVKWGWRAGIAPKRGSEITAKWKSRLAIQRAERDSNLFCIAVGKPSLREMHGG